jgi:hypothetical protein
LRVALSLRYRRLISGAPPAQQVGSLFNQRPLAYATSVYLCVLCVEEEIFALKQLFIPVHYQFSFAAGAMWLTTDSPSNIIKFASYQFIKY